jgi:hypothetical protein
VPDELRGALGLVHPTTDAAAQLAAQKIALCPAGTRTERGLILGLTGLDQPFNWATTEVVVWTCVALSILTGDLADQ